MNTVKQYQNNKGIVMFIDDRQKRKTIVSYNDIFGKTINNNDNDALTFFQHEPYLVTEFD